MLEELRELHRDLGRKLDRIKSEQPNDNEGIAIAAARMKGVGMAIEIVQRHQRPIDRLDQPFFPEGPNGLDGD